MGACLALVEKLGAVASAHEFAQDRLRWCFQTWLRFTLLHQRARRGAGKKHAESTLTAHQKLVTKALSRSVPEHWNSVVLLAVESSPKCTPSHRSRTSACSVRCRDPLRRSLSRSMPNVGTPLAQSRVYQATPRRVLFTAGLCDNQR